MWSKLWEMCKPALRVAITVAVLTLVVSAAVDLIEQLYDLRLALAIVVGWKLFEPALSLFQKYDILQ